MALSSGWELLLVNTFLEVLLILEQYFILLKVHLAWVMASSCHCSILSSLYRTLSIAPFFSPSFFSIGGTNKSQNNPRHYRVYMATEKSYFPNNHWCQTLVSITLILSLQHLKLYEDTQNLFSWRKIILLYVRNIHFRAQLWDSKPFGRGYR